jgi:hypothetical protein
VVDGAEEPSFSTARFSTGDDERRKKHDDEPNNGAHDVASMAAEIAQLDCLGAHSRRHVSHCGQTTPSAASHAGCSIGPSEGVDPDEERGGIRAEKRAGDRRPQPITESVLVLAGGVGHVGHGDEVELGIQHRNGPVVPTGCSFERDQRPWPDPTDFATPEKDCSQTSCAVNEHHFKTGSATPGLDTHAAYSARNPASLASLQISKAHAIVW